MVLGARPPQGHPVIIQADQSDNGRDRAARIADVIFSPLRSLADTKAYYADIPLCASACFGLRESQTRTYLFGDPIEGEIGSPARFRPILALAVIRRNVSIALRACRQLGSGCGALRSGTRLPCCALRWCIAVGRTRWRSARRCSTPHTPHTPSASHEAGLWWGRCRTR